ncbi:MAG: succinate dehydrogenase cytochrome b subunit [Verrucomicrobia bacterium]|nr:succinate dehydrogenase cytochrome b subunit [Verrucomicrobiota bacterium]
MNPAGLLFRSSIGRKFLMAATGLILVGFVTGHLVGNLQIFAHPDKINGYAHFLQSLGPALWAVRLGLLACVVLHVWAAVALALENRAARGPEPYGVSTWLDATFASRYMKHTGLVVLAFIVYHLAHFTVGAAQAGSFKSNLPDYSMGGDFHLLGFPLVAKGQTVHDVYSMVFLGFANPVVSLFYIVAVGLLSLHLLHGVDSMFQTFGWRNHRWSCWLRKLVLVYSLAYFLGNVAIPGAILGGVAQPVAGTTAAKKMAVAVTSTSVSQR